MKFERIEIHFKTRNNEDRTVIISRNTEVRGILLDRNEPPQPEIPKAKGMKLAGGEVDPGDGPGVCYDVGGELQCW